MGYVILKISLWRNDCFTVKHITRGNKVLYFDLRPGQKCHSEWCTGRKWHILMADMRGNRVGGNWLMKWDEVKNSHGTLIDWRSGREWPVNCMTVISTWWRSNMRFQRSSGRSSGRWTITWLSQDRSQDSWVAVPVGDGAIDEMQ